MLTRRRVGSALAVGLSGLATVPVVVTWIENRQAGETERLLPVASPVDPSTQRTAVVVFSRSGNTALLARHLAKRLNASLYRLLANDYALGFAGWVNAMRDATNHAAAIAPQTIDLSGHDMVLLCSPIWMFSPAPPLWQFVQQSRLEGKHVVLVNTFNSRFKSEYIETFRQTVLARGASSFEHQFIRRGRMGWQLAPQEMLDSFDARWAT